MYLDFDCVSVGSFNSLQFLLINPNKDRSVKISVCKLPEAKGFDILLGPKGATEIEIGANAKVSGVVTWSPKANMTVREVAKLNLHKENGVSPLQVTLVGKSGTGKNEDKPKQKPNRKALVAIAPREFATKTKTAKAEEKVVFNRNSQNQWADKQIQNFTAWMNLTFHKANMSSVEISTVSEQIYQNSETGHTSGLKSLMRKRLEAQIRQKAVLAYHHQDTAVPLFQLGEEIESGTIVVRSDRDVHADLGLQQTLLELVFSYELPYLKLGLEVVFGEVIPIKAGKDGKEDVPCSAGDSRWKKVLKSFVEEKMLSDASIKCKFPKHKLLFPEHQQELKAQLRAHLVKKFLALVLVIDKARMDRIVGMPSLFCAESEIRSSKTMLSTFCMEFLSGQGNFTRYLSNIKYEVFFEQTFVDEFDYTVKALQVDLRDGVRLTKLVELLTSTDDLSAQLRVPAGSLLQKLHNINLALDRAFGTINEPGVDARGVIEGNREATLFLLWKLQYKFNGQTLTDPALVRAETRSIKSDKQWRGTVYSEADIDNFAVKVPVKKSSGEVIYPAVDTAGGTAELDDNAPEAAVQQHALVEWCNCIANMYGIAVDDITNSLADGRALCLLIHYYHPSILSISSIKKTFQNILSENDEEEVAITNSDMQRALDGERRNFVSLKNACKTIGGIPLMIPHYDSKNIPEAKLMTVFLGYLFTRLVESAEQLRASIRIQRCYKKYALTNPSKRKVSHAVRTSKKGAPSKYPVREFLDEVGVTDVGCTVVMSVHSAANMIKQLVRTYTARRSYARLLKKRQQELVYQQLEEQRWAEISAKEQERWRLESEAVLERENQLLLEEQRCAVEKLAEEEDAVQKQAQLEQDAIDQRIQREEEEFQRKLQQVRMETADALRIEFSTQAEKDLEKHSLALEETAKQVLEETAQEMAAKDLLLQEESRRRQELEEKLAELEDARYEAEENARVIELRRQELEEQLAEHENMNEELQEKLDSETQKREDAIEQTKCIMEQQASLQQRHDEENVVSVIRSQHARETESMAMTHMELEAKWQAETRAREALEARLSAIEEKKRAFEIAEQQRQVAKAQFDKLCQASAGKLQVVWKCYAARRFLRVSRGLAQKTQALVRGFLVRRTINKLRAIVLAKMKNAAACIITKWVRKCKSSNALKSSMRTALRASICIKSAKQAKEKQALRFKEATHAICKFFVGYRPLRRAQIMNHGFARFAAFFRSVRVRWSCVGPLREIYARLKETQLRENENIGARTLEAIATLQTVKSISQVSASCKVLMVTTEVSLECCTLLTNAHISHILFNTIRSCNRSTAHQELLTYALMVLLNVSRRGKLAATVALVPHSADILVDLMQMFRDKSSVFGLACELLCRLCSSKKELKVLCNTTDCRKRLDGISHIIERKHKLDTRVANIGSATPSKELLAQDTFVSTPKGKGSFLAERNAYAGIKHLLFILSSA